MKKSFPLWIAFVALLLAIVCCSVCIGIAVGKVDGKVGFESGSLLMLMGFVVNLICVLLFLYYRDILAQV